MKKKIAVSIPREANRVESMDGSVVLCGAYFECTGCDRVLPATYFGALRQMQDTKIRNQAQCQECRAIR